MTFNSDVEDLISTIHVMLLQEKSGYLVSEYLSDHHDLQQATAPNKTAVPRPVDADCRFKTSIWYYQVIDFWRYNRETGSIAMSYLDRFLSTKIGRKALDDRRVFQLASITCLYTALKIHEPVKIEPSTFAQLSRGLYTDEQIEAMERVILETLEWRLNPPTPKAFLHYFLELIPTQMMTSALRAALLEIATSQLELSVGEYIFATLKPSTVAMSALLNAVDSVDDDLAHDVRLLLSTAVAMDCDSPLIEQTQDRLFEVIERRPESTSSSGIRSTKAATPTLPISSVHHASPRSVLGAH